MILDDRARGDTNAYVPVTETVRDTRFELCDLKLHLLDVRSCCVEVGRSHSGHRCQDATSRASQRCLAGRIGRLAAIAISVESCLMLYKVILPTLRFSIYGPADGTESAAQYQSSEASIVRHPALFQSFHRHSCCMIAR